jgi:hypothetical protein
MPIALARSDRRLLLISGAVLAILLAAVAVLSPPPDQGGGGIPSVYSTGSGGARAAYLLLKELNYHVEVWENSPAELPEVSGNAVLILANPAMAPEGEERDALRKFVESGGRVLFTGPIVGAFFKDADVSEEPLAREWQTYTANVPSGFTAGARKIRMQPQAEWEGLSSSQTALYGDALAPVVVRWRVGKGEILWWGGPTPLTNAGIPQEQNLNLFLDAVSSAAVSGVEQRDIYWDEYFHGERSSLWGYVQKTPVPWGLLQLAILCVAIFFTFGRRSGPIAAPVTVPRLAPLEFVETLGGLYQRAHAEPALIGVVYQRLRAMVSRQLRLPVAASDAELESAVRARLAAKDSTQVDALSRAAAASRMRRIKPNEALAIIRGLERLEAELGFQRRKV